jgi:hypothetical protein
MADVFTKLRSFSHTEYSKGRFNDPNYVYARIACGYGVLPTRWKMPEKLTLVDFDAENIDLPDDPRFNFLKFRIGFKDLKKFRLNMTGIRTWKPEDCRLKVDDESIEIGTLV